MSWNFVPVAERVSRSRLGTSMLIWHFLSLQSNHTGLCLSSLNPLQTLTHNDPILNMSLHNPELSCCPFKPATSSPTPNMNNELIFNFKLC